MNILDPSFLGGAISGLIAIAAGVIGCLFTAGKVYLHLKSGHISLAESQAQLRDDHVSLRETVEKTQKEFSAMRESLAANYVPRDHFDWSVDKMENRLKETLERVEASVGSRFDRIEASVTGLQESFREMLVDLLANLKQRPPRNLG